ncbi:MAG: hypothetical protein ACRD6N_03975, partial [Pyrinomonadaceae bacterium]
IVALLALPGLLLLLWACVVIFSIFGGGGINAGMGGFSVVWGIPFRSALLFLIGLGFIVLAWALLRRLLGRNIRG